LDDDFLGGMSRNRMKVRQSIGGCCTILPRLVVVVVVVVVVVLFALAVYISYLVDVPGLARILKG
jgi:hypothetical protein